MVGIGDTLYRFDVNRRVYQKGGQFSGGPIYREHFEPLKIEGENARSWVLERGWKVNKKTLRGEAASFSYGGRGFFTAEQMEADIWQHDHRHKIRDLFDRCSVAQLREIANLLGYGGAS
jgi:hypothetical protein